MKNFSDNFLGYLTDEGAFFGRLKEGEVFMETFFETPEKFLGSPFKKSLEKEPFKSLVILLDTGHQSYRSENLSSLSFLERFSFLRHQKNRCRLETSLVASLQQSPHHYLIVSIGEAPLNSWFLALSSLPNPLKKIIPAPLEIVSFVNSLSFPHACIFVRSLDKKFGLRQTILLHKNLFLTRLIPIPQKGKLNVKEETEKTLNYVARQTGIPITEIHILDLGEVPGKAALFSLKEISKKIGLKYTTSPPSLPLLLCACGVMSKGGISFLPTLLRKKKMLQYTGKVLIITGWIFFVLGAGILVYPSSLSKKIEEKKERLHSLAKGLAEEESAPISPSDQHRMTHLVEAVKSFKNGPHPFSFLNTAGPLLKPEWALKEINWTTEKTEVILEPNGPKATLKSLTLLTIPGYKTSVRSLNGREALLTCSS